jgi:DNA-binding beta-propeller fold protein YncE
MTRTCTWALAALLLLVAAPGTFADSPESGYHVIKKIPLGGQGGWDYLTMDSDAHRLYISRSDRVMVLDVDQGKIVGEVPKTDGVHGIALAPKHKRGFTSNGRDSTVTIFDMETLKEIGRVQVGKGPDAIIYDPATDRVFTFNAGSKDATAVSAEDGKVAGTIKLEGRPEFAVADEKGHVYVGLVDKNELLALDAKELSVKHRWPLGAGKGPHGITMDRAKGHVYVGCANEMMVVVDAANGKVIGTPKIGRGNDACGFDQEAGLAFSSNGDGTLTVIEEKPAGQFRVENVKTERGARTMALDTKTHNIYLATARFKEQPGGQRGRPTMEPDSFMIVVVGKGASK